MISKTSALVVFVLFALTWYLLQITSTVTAIPIRKPLSQFPRTIGNYHLANSFQSSADEIKMLGVDDYIQYNYVTDSPGRINFYVGYYQAVGVTGGYHSPKNCLPGGGWGIDTVKEVVLNAGVEGKNKATVSEMLIRNGSEYQVVLYWYQNRGRIIASEYWEKIYLVLDAMLMGRRDGAFIRIMSTVPPNQIEASEEKIRRFAEEAMTLLVDYLPGSHL